MRISAGWFGEVDFTDWFRGLVSSFITGLSAAGAASLAAASQAPSQLALGSMASFKVMAVTGLISGGLGMLNFLRSRPLPELKKVITTVQTTEMEDKPTKVVTTVEETKVEPVKPVGDQK